MSAETRTEASRRINLGVADWLRTRPEIRSLGIFAALPGEPDLRDLHHHCPATALIYPLVHPDRRLSFHRVHDPNTLVSGHFGIMEPDPARHPELPVGSIDGFLCPGLAFDASGTRLGRGGGFYDRALEQARPDAIRVGVCFGLQLAATLPREAHDRVMGLLATENGVRELRPSPERSS